MIDINTNIEEKLKELGLCLPEAAKPVATYVPAVRSGNLLFISGQGPIENGSYKYLGKVGSDLSIEEGYDAAKHVALNCIAVLKQEVGDLSKVKRFLKLLGWVNSAPGFHRQPEVINGASDLLFKLFGEKGQHARSAVSANELPFNIPVEIELIAEIETDGDER